MYFLLFIMGSLVLEKVDVQDARPLSILLGVTIGSKMIYALVLLLFYWLISGRISSLQRVTISSQHAE